MKFRNFFACVTSSIITAMVLVSCVTPSPSAYTVTFDYNYDGAPANYTQEVADGGVVTPPANPTRENYAFDGWYNESTCKTEADFEYSISGDVTYYAGWTQTSAVITYNPNYDGATSTTATVTIGEKATQPEAPTRDGYVFAGWYTDAACTEEFTFTAEISADMTLYANWEESAGDTVTVVFSNNYEGAGDYYTQTINTGRRVAKPADPVRTDGYAFIDWYVDAACTQTYNFNTFLSENTTIYAKWSKIHTFEAEYTNVKGLTGVGWSSSVEGLGLIDVDNMNGGASNGFFVGYMYVTGNTLTFNITAEEAVDDAVLVLRLTAEGEEGSVVSLTDEELLIKVNDNKLVYDGLLFNDIPDITGGTRRPFSNHVIHETVSLQKGNNVIQLIVNNTKSMGGTMTATAPMFDCMYIYTNTNLSWTEGQCYESNLDGLR